MEPPTLSFAGFERNSARVSGKLLPPRVGMSATGPSPGLFSYVGSDARLTSNRERTVHVSRIDVNPLKHPARKVSFKLCLLSLFLFTAIILVTQAISARSCASSCIEDTRT